MKLRSISSLLFNGTFAFAGCDSKGYLLSISRTSSCSLLLSLLCIFPYAIVQINLALFFISSMFGQMLFLLVGLVFLRINYFYIFVEMKEFVEDSHRLLGPVGFLALLHA